MSGGRVERVGVRRRDVLEGGGRVFSSVGKLAQLGREAQQVQRRLSGPGASSPPLRAHQRKFDILVFWALDRLTREGTRATLNYLQRLESKGVDYVSYQEQWLDSTGPFKDVKISMFATLAKQERARISERTMDNSPSLKSERCRSDIQLRLLWRLQSHLRRSGSL
jgi:hypothetical protein